MDTDVDAMAEDPRFHCLLRERMKFMKAKSPFKMMVRIFVFTPSCHPQSRSICLYTKRSSKSRKPSEIAHTDSHAHKNKESVYSLTCYTCVLMSLPGDSEQSITGQRIRHCWCVRVLWNISNVQFRGPFWSPSLVLQFQLIDSTPFVHAYCLRAVNIYVLKYWTLFLSSSLYTFLERK